MIKSGGLKTPPRTDEGYQAETFEIGWKNQK